MIASFRPGTSAIHRIPAGPKILLLIVLTAVLVVQRDVLLLIAGAAVGCLYLVAGLGARELVRQVLGLRWIIVFMLATQLVFLPASAAMTNTGRVLVAIMLSTLFTVTTPTNELLDAMERGLAPLRRFGVNPGKVGLLLATTITAIPVIAGFASTIRDAQKARGARLRLRTMVVPLLVMSLKHSDELADALIARGAD